MEEGRVETISDESLKRLYEVDKIRDAAIENDEKLRELGVQKMLFFGSAMNGSANKDSDTDLCVIYHYVPGGFKESFERQEKLMTGLCEIVPGSERDSSFKNAQEGQKQDILHITLVPDNDDYFQEHGTPEFAQGALTLWPKQAPEDGNKS